MSILGDISHTLDRENSSLSSESVLPADKTRPHRPQTATTGSHDKTEDRLGSCAPRDHHRHRRSHKTLKLVKTSSLSASSASRSCNSSIVETWIQTETYLLTLKQHLDTLRDECRALSSIKMPTLAYDLEHEPRMQALHGALEDTTISYLNQIYFGFRHLRHLVASSPPDSAHVEALLRSPQRYVTTASASALINALLCDKNQTLLTPSAIHTLFVHCGTTASDQVDMKLFLRYLHTAAPPRERYIRYAFDMLSAHTVETSTSVGRQNDSGNHELRIFKLHALVKDNVAKQRCSAADAQETLQWLQTFDGRQLTLYKKNTSLMNDYPHPHPHPPPHTHHDHL
jgi:hypothetical protein